MAPTNTLSTSSSFSITFFSHQSSALWPLSPQLLHSPLKQGFLAVLLLFLFSFLFPQQSGALWTYLPHLFHSPLKNLLFLFIHFFYPDFNSRTLSSGSYFSLVFLPLSCVFQNQHISFFRNLNYILAMFTLHENLNYLYLLGKKLKTYALSYF